MKKAIIRIALSAFSLLSSQAHAASFDCTKASTPNEHAICADGLLAAGDEEVSADYFKLKTQLSSDPQATSELLDAQRLWLKSIRGCEGDRTCLLSAFNKRHSQLTQQLYQARSHGSVASTTVAGAANVTVPVDQSQVTADEPPVVQPHQAVADNGNANAVPASENATASSASEQTDDLETINRRHDARLNLLASIAAILLAPLFSRLMRKRYNAIAPGYVINLEDGTFSFPAGGFSPNDPSELLTKSFWLQFFERRTVKLSQISRIVSRTKGGKESYTKMDIIGEFGHATLHFERGQTRDRVFALISKHNKMGTPVVVR